MADQHETRPALEQDARIARVLGAALMIVLPTFGFYAGTVLGKPWIMDYQLKDVAGGLKGLGVGLVLAVLINIYAWFWYPKTVAKDAEHEWYEPQSGHH